LAWFFLSPFDHTIKTFPQQGIFVYFIVVYTVCYSTKDFFQRKADYMHPFRILIIGDVFGKPGREYLRKVLPVLKHRENADFCIVNGENSADSNGIDLDSAESIFVSGADVITTGNHAFDRKNQLSVFENERVIRPANYHSEVPGQGFCIVDCGAVRVQVINLSGAVFMNPVRNPYDTALEILEQKGDALISILDFHGEATSEKKALGLWLDGKITCIYGTHTHVQTADEEILPGGTAYITDIGMTGPYRSIIGMDPALAISRLRTGFAKGQKAAEGPCMLCGILVVADRDTGKALEIKRIQVKE